MVRLFTGASRCFPRGWSVMVTARSGVSIRESAGRGSVPGAPTSRRRTNAGQSVSSMLTSTTISPGITAKTSCFVIQTVGLYSDASHSRHFMLDCASSTARIVLKPANATRTTALTFQQRPLAVPMPVTTVVPTSFESRTTGLAA